MITTTNLSVTPRNPSFEPHWVTPVQPRPHTRHIERRADADHQAVPFAYHTKRSVDVLLVYTYVC